MRSGPDGASAGSSDRTTRSTLDPLSKFLRNNQSELDNQKTAAKTAINDDDLWDDLVTIIDAFRSERELKDIDEVLEEICQKRGSVANTAAAAAVPETVAAAQDLDDETDPTTSSTVVEVLTPEKALEEIHKIIDLAIKSGSYSISFVGFSCTSSRDELFDGLKFDSNFREVWGLDDQNNVLSISFKGNTFAIHVPCSHGDIDKAMIMAGLNNTGRWLRQVEAALNGTANFQNDHLISGLIIPKESVHDLFPGDLTKSRACVIGGESGSGKSVYSRKYLPKGDGAVVLYMSITSSDLTEFGAAPDNPEGLSAWRSLLRALMVYLFQQNNEYSSTSAFYRKLSEASSKLGEERNVWALEFAKSLMDKKIQTISKEHLTRWWESREYGITDAPVVDRLVIIFDEAAREMQFADGMVAVVRDFLRQVVNERPVKEAALVLCGSGLEILNMLDSGRRYLRSDPSLSCVLTMGQPRMDMIPELGSADSNTRGAWPIRAAVKNGVYSSILATNARMLGQGIRRALTCDLINFAGDRGTGMDQQDRQTQFASHHLTMEYAVRKYESLSSLGEREFKERDNMYQASFQYMHTKALQTIGAEDGNELSAAKIIARYSPASIETDHDMFKMGLVTVDPDNTSPALKLLACGGHIRPTFAADGETFEGTLAGHLHRMYECWGYKVYDYTLQAAWPSPIHHTIGDDEKLIIQMDVKAIAGYLKSVPGNVAVVLRQSHKNAQGADVMVFSKKVGTSVELLLEAFQAKNWKKKLSPSELLTAAKSLGIGANGKVVVEGSMDASSSEQEREDHRSAVHSGWALDCLKENVDKLMDNMENATRLRRIVVMSQTAVGFERDSKWDFDVWGKEHLEPSISLWPYTEKSTVDMDGVTSAMTDTNI